MDQVEGDTREDLIEEPEQRREQVTSKFVGGTQGF